MGGLDFKGGPGYKGKKERMQLRGARGGIQDGWRQELIFSGNNGPPKDKAMKQDELEFVYLL